MAILQPLPGFIRGQSVIGESSTGVPPTSRSTSPSGFYGIGGTGLGGPAVSSPSPVTKSSSFQPPPEPVKVIEPVQPNPQSYVGETITPIPVTYYRVYGNPEWIRQEGWGFNPKATELVSTQDNVRTYSRPYTFFDYAAEKPQQTQPPSILPKLIEQPSAPKPPQTTSSTTTTATTQAGGSTLAKIQASLNDYSMRFEEAARNQYPVNATLPWGSTIESKKIANILVPVARGGIGTLQFGVGLANAGEYALWKAGQVRTIEGAGRLASGVKKGTETVFTEGVQFAAKVPIATIALIAEPKPGKGMVSEPMETRVGNWLAAVGETGAALAVARGTESLSPKPIAKPSATMEEFKSRSNSLVNSMKEFTTRVNELRTGVEPTLKERPVISLGRQLMDESNMLVRKPLTFSKTTPGLTSVSTPKQFKAVFSKSPYQNEIILKNEPPATASIISDIKVRTKPLEEVTKAYTYSSSETPVYSRFPYILKKPEKTIPPSPSFKVEYKTQSPFSAEVKIDRLPHDAPVVGKYFEEIFYPNKLKTIKLEKIESIGQRIKPQTDYFSEFNRKLFEKGRAEYAIKNPDYSKRVIPWSIKDFYENLESKTESIPGWAKFGSIKFTIEEQVQVPRTKPSSPGLFGEFNRRFNELPYQDLGPERQPSIRDYSFEDLRKTTRIKPIIVPIQIIKPGERRGIKPIQLIKLKPSYSEFIKQRTFTDQVPSFDSRFKFLPSFKLGELQAQRTSQRQLPKTVTSVGLSSYRPGKPIERVVEEEVPEKKSPFFRRRVYSEVEERRKKKLISFKGIQLKRIKSKKIQAPIADWISKTITEIQTKRPATQLKVTPQVQKEFAKVIARGGGYFPTAELAKGKVKKPQWINKKIRF